MGWIGLTYLGRCPKGRERIDFVISRCQLNWENETQKLEVLDSAMVGTTVYAACRRTMKETGAVKVFAVIILTSYDTQRKEFLYKDMDETCGPGVYSCPKRLIRLLTEPSNEYAANWRRKCMERKSQRSELSKLPFGSVIQLHNPQRSFLEVTTYHGKRAYVNLEGTCKASPRCIKSWGYEIVSTPKKGK